MIQGLKCFMIFPRTEFDPKRMLSLRKSVGNRQSLFWGTLPNPNKYQHWNPFHCGKWTWWQFTAFCGSVPPFMLKVTFLSVAKKMKWLTLLVDSVRNVRVVLTLTIWQVKVIYKHSKFHKVLIWILTLDTVLSKHLFVKKSSYQTENFATKMPSCRALSK